VIAACANAEVALIQIPKTKCDLVLMDIDLPGQSGIDCMQALKAQITTSGSDPTTPVSATSLPRVPVTLDTKGRVRVSKEQQRLILAEFERSGISAAEFAKRSGIKYPTFAGWVQRHRRNKPKAPPPGMRLLEAVVEQAPRSGQLPLTLQLPGGAWIEIHNLHQAALAADLLRVLAKSC